MDIGRKCLIMAVIGFLLAFASSPFVIHMAFTGRPFITYIGREAGLTLSNIYGPESKTVNGTGIVMRVRLDPEGKNQYMVVLNVNTNTTIHTSIYKENSSSVASYVFNAGNSTATPQIASSGMYVWSITGTDNRKANATFKLVESWRYASMELEPQIDFLKTGGTAVAFVAGISLLVYSLVKLRKAARETRPAATRETVRKQPRYVEVEEDEEE